MEFKNLKTEKEKIDFLKIQMRKYFVPFFEKIGGYMTVNKWGNWSYKDFPTLEGFLVDNDIDFDFWEKVKTEPVLKNEITRAKAIVKDIVIKGGASGAFNPKFASLMAQNFFNWTAKSETKETGRQSSVIINILNERKKRKLPTIMDTTAKRLTKQARLTKLAKKSSLDSDNSNEDVPVELDKLGDS